MLFRHLLVLFIMLFCLPAQALELPEYELRFAANVNEGSENQDISNTAAEGQISKDSHYYYAELAFPSSYGGWFGHAKSSEYLYRLMDIQRITSGTEQGYPVAGNMESTMLAYGRRYYLFSENREGLSYGWITAIIKYSITGVAMSLDKQSIVLANVSKSETTPMAGLNIAYVWKPIKNLFLEAEISAMYRKNYNDYELQQVTALNIGVSF